MTDDSFYTNTPMLAHEPTFKIEVGFASIKTKGGIEVIEYLQFIVDNDIDKYKRDKASEAIGYIKGRFS